MSELRYKSLLDPSLILNPASLSLALLVFGKDSGQILVPVSWLWEHWSSVQSVISLTDILAYHARNTDKNLRTKVLDPHTHQTSSVSSLLQLGIDNDLIVGVVTQEGRRFLRLEAEGIGWTESLTAYFPKLHEIKLTEAETNLSRSISQELTAESLHVPLCRVEKIAEDIDLAWHITLGLETDPDTHRIWDYEKDLEIIISYIMAGAKENARLVTIDRELEEFIGRKLNSLYSPQRISNDDHMVPITRLVKRGITTLTAGEIISMIENRKLLEKLGGVIQIQRNVELLEEKKDFVKSLLLYILGLIPYVDLPSKIIEGFNFIYKGLTLQESEINNRSLLYFDMNAWRKRLAS